MPGLMNQNSQVFDISFGLLSAGVLFLMGLYHAVLFAYRTKNSANLIFALFTFIGAYRMLETGSFIQQLLSSVPWDVWLRMDHASNGLFLILLYLFVRHRLPGFLNSDSGMIPVILSMLYALSTAVIPLEYLDAALYCFSIVFLLGAIRILAAEVRALRRKTTLSHFLLLLTSVFFIATLCNDILFMLQVWRTDYLAPFGLIPLVIGHWLSLAREYGSAYSVAEQRLDEFMHAMAKAISSKSSFTGEHIERVTRLSMRIAWKLRLPAAQRRQLFLGAVVHDLGKIHLPDEILDKPGELTPDELEKMRSHPLKGWEMLEHVEGLTMPRLIIRHHHEHWDGTGYPDGLSGHHIPLEARIVALADHWDAITSPRAYRDALPFNKACDVLRREAGRALDPQLVRLFLKQRLWREESV